MRVNGLSSPTGAGVVGARGWAAWGGGFAVVVWLMVKAAQQVS